MNHRSVVVAFGLGFATALVIAGGIAWYVNTVPHVYEEESREYAQDVVKKFTNEPSIDVLRAELIAGVRSDSELAFTQLWLTQLGPLKTLKSSDGRHGLYRISGEFERGEASILLNVVKNAGQWKVSDIAVDGPALTSHLTADSFDRPLRINLLTGFSEYEYGGKWYPVFEPVSLNDDDLKKVSVSGQLLGPGVVVHVYNGTGLALLKIKFWITFKDKAGVKIIDREYMAEGPVGPLAAGEIMVPFGQEIPGLGPNGEHYGNTCDIKVMFVYAAMIPSPAPSPENP